MAAQHRILTAIWHMLTHDVAYHDLGPDYFDHKPRSLQHQAQRARRLIAELIEQGYDVSQLIPEHPA
ncbi:hypothetical protein [Lentzea sp.]|uniref:hypothetical protein n=1 Tax=Lentzea sp. TaxID=56099 RepID=UPI002BC74993|nr:hypothetical protein [Lentzea sp.]HUQ54827.1 hypothetical protein [Lentzea sp.]